MLCPSFDPFPVLATARLILRKVDPSDVDELYVLRSDPRMMRYLDRAPAASPAEAADFIRRILDLEARGEAVTWALTNSGDPTLIGTICFWNIQKEHYRAEIGYALHPEHQGHGLMHEALQAVLTCGFQTLRLHSVEAHVNPENRASIRLLERNGFVREGYFRENYFYDGRFFDTAVYSKVAPFDSEERMDEAHPKNPGA